MSEALVRGAWDLHVHAAPGLFPRWGDGRDLAESCAEAGMGGLLLKAHHGSTVDVAHLLRRDFPRMQIHGGVTLNRFVGGLNPLAVELCLNMGGRAVWLPTVHARQHARAFGTPGAGDPGLAVLDDAGHLLPEVCQILELLHGRPVLLGTGHLAPEEIFSLQRHIEARGLEVRLVVTHPFFRVPALSVEQVREPAGPGVAFEVCYHTVSPLARAATCAAVARGILAVPGARWVMASDSGQRDTPPAPRALAAFCDALLEHGVPRELLHRMLHDEPAALMAT